MLQRNVHGHRIRKRDSIVQICAYHRMTNDPQFISFVRNICGSPLGYDCPRPVQVLLLISVDHALDLPGAVVVVQIPARIQLTKRAQKGKQQYKAA